MHYNYAESIICDCLLIDGESRIEIMKKRPYESILMKMLTPAFKIFLYVTLYAQNIETSTVKLVFFDFRAVRNEAKVIQHLNLCFISTIELLNRSGIQILDFMLC